MIVDDHPVVREGLASLIRRRPDMAVVAEASNGQEAVAQHAIHRPDVTLMDLRLPEMDGVTAIQAIRAKTPGARFLIVTTYDGDEDIHRAIHAGARGYILKDVPRENMLEAIRTVHSGKIYLPGDVSTRLVERMRGPEVSEREREILYLVAEGKSNQEIATLLRLTEGTVKIHVHRIMNKLEANDRTHAVTTAIRRGILHL
jgi:two-component system NarL family response regulator